MRHDHRLPIIPNPYWEPELRNLTGLDQPVINFLEEKEQVQEYKKEIEGFLRGYLKKSLQNRPGMKITIGFGCTGGQHRSVYLASALAKALKDQYSVMVHHRELEGGQR